MSEFEQRNKVKIGALGADARLKGLTRDWFRAASAHEYSYHFSWMGRPVIQFPQDLVAMQELIWSIRPDLIVETGVAHGGSLIFYASMLQLLGAGGRVVGIDVEIREHNRRAIEAHPMFRHISLIEGSSIDEGVVAQAFALAKGRRVMVCLDSNHSHDHVLRELHLYSPLVKRGSYLVVFDTIVEQLTPELLGTRPWGPGNSAATAVSAFLSTTDRFVVDDEIDHKLLISVAPGGYLKCVKD